MMTGPGDGEKERAFWSLPSLSCFYLLGHEGRFSAAYAYPGRGVG